MAGVGPLVALDDQAEGLLVGKRGLVGAYAAQRVVHVADRHDPCFQRDGVPHKPARIAAAIPFLMMILGNGRTHAGVG